MQSSFPSSASRFLQWKHPVFGAQPIQFKNKLKQPCPVSISVIRNVVSPWDLFIQWANKSGEISSWAHLHPLPVDVSGHIILLVHLASVASFGKRTLDIDRRAAVRVFGGHSLNNVIFCSWNALKRLMVIRSMGDMPSSDTHTRIKWPSAAVSLLTQQCFDNYRPRRAPTLKRCTIKLNARRSLAGTSWSLVDHEHLVSGSLERPSPSAPFRTQHVNAYCDPATAIVTQVTRGIASVLFYVTYVTYTYVTGDGREWQVIVVLYLAHRVTHPHGHYIVSESNTGCFRRKRKVKHSVIRDVSVEGLITELWGIPQVSFITTASPWPSTNSCSAG